MSTKSSHLRCALAIYTAMAVTTNVSAFSTPINSSIHSRPTTCCKNNVQKSLIQLHASSPMSDNNQEEGTQQQQQQQQQPTQRNQRDTGPKNESTSKNEFSRTIRVSKWFAGGAAGGGASGAAGGGGHRQSKSMNLSITATSTERTALAQRFHLSDISSLSAELTIQPAFLGVNGRNSGGAGTGGSHRGGNENNDCIEARGTVVARVTQNCVRTNEEFDVDLEFSFDTVFRAMEGPLVSSGSNSGGGGASTSEGNLSEGELAALQAAAQLDSKAGGGSRKKKGGNGNKKHRSNERKGVRGGQSSRNLDAMGMKELQDILMEYEVTDEIIEDETCFCTDGIVDAGEIVAQMFRSKLDPYPKKPGSDPVSYTFTF